jgi:MFS family permease
LHGGLAILIFSGDVAIWQLVIIEAGFGLAEAVYRPAFAGLLPQTLPEEQIQSGWGLAHASENASMAFGPLIATGLVLGAGAGWAFAADAATFLVSAVTIALVRPRKRGGSSVEAQKSSFVVNLRLGWGEVRRRVWVWASILSTAGLLFLSIAPWFVLAPSVSKANWGTTSYYGIHEAFFGVGTVLGALLAARFRPLRPLRAGYMLMAMWPAQFVLFGLGAPLPLVFSAAFLAGLGMGSFGVFWETCLANWIPPDRLSRVTSWDWLGSVALWPVGLAIAGPIGEALGPRDVVIFAGVAGGLCIALGAIPRQTRALRAGPASDADERAATVKVA